jgi:hypothetical protein
MYGSLINRLQERMVVGAPTPVVGMGATMTSYSDRHAGTIIEVKKVGKGLLITVQADDVKRIDNNGMSESQEYQYTPNPNGATYLYKQKEPNTRWVAMYMNQETGRLNKSERGGLVIGERDEYYDFSF